MIFSTRVLGIACLVLFIVLISFGFYSDSFTSETGKTAHGLIVNFAFTLLGVALTVLVIDKLNDQRANSDLKRSLIRDLLLGDTAISRRAINELSSMGALADGTMRNAELAGAEIDTIDLTNSDLSEANLVGATFKNCDLANSNLSGTKMNDAFFEGCTFDTADLYSAKLIGTKFLQCDLREANFEKANPSNAQFVACQLTKAQREILTKGGSELKDRP